MIRLVSFILALAGASTALGQAYPVRPVRVITPQTAGASLDVVVRIVAAKVSELLGQTFVVDNRGGAGGIIGTESGARAAPDGYTLTAGAPAMMIIARFTQRSLPYDPLRDFTPISLLVNAEALMVVQPSIPARNVQEFIALAKSQPGKLNMASAGIGSSSHLAGVLFTSLTGIDTVHIPYKGGGSVATSVVSGEAQWSIVPAAAVATQVRAGRLRALAVSTVQRSPFFPDLPTLQEAGVRGYEYNAWNGLFAPTGTPRHIVSALHAAIQKALADGDVKRQYASQGLAPAGSDSPEQFRTFLRADHDRIARLVRTAGIKPE